MYEPTTGRFLEEDPIGIEGADSNFYRYCGNSPTNHTDPSGLQSLPAGGGASQGVPPTQPVPGQLPPPSQSPSSKPLICIEDYLLPPSVSELAIDAKPIVVFPTDSQSGLRLPKWASDLLSRYSKKLSRRSGALEIAPAGSAKFPPVGNVLQGKIWPAPNSGHECEIQGGLNISR
jgi:hypothetical protein